MRRSCGEKTEMNCCAASSPSTRCCERKRKRCGGWLRKKNTIRIGAFNGGRRAELQREDNGPLAHRFQRPNRRDPNPATRWMAPTPRRSARGCCTNSPDQITVARWRPTQDSRTRKRIAANRAMLARQAFGAFSNQEVERIYAEEMQTRRGRIAFGDTDLSVRAFRLRERSGVQVGNGRNVAVIEYRDANGNMQYIERATTGGPHAEELAIRELERLRVSHDSVTRIYTDRQPCSERCLDRLRPYGNARVTWAVDWPDHEEGRAIANSALERQIRSYRRMESQGTLLPLWRHPNPAGNDPPRPRRRRRR